MRKHVLYTFLAVSLLSSTMVVMTGCSNDPVSGQTVDIPEVKVMTLGDVQKGAMAAGKIIPDQEVKIVSKVPGRVANIMVEDGTVVKKGDTLLQLEAEDFVLQAKQAEAGISASEAKLADVKAGARVQEIKAAESGVQQTLAAIQQSESAVKQAKSALELAQKSFDRVKALYDQSAISQAELDKSTLELERAKSGVEQAVAQQQVLKGQYAAALAKLDLTKAGATQNTVKSLQADITRQKAGLELAQNAVDNTRVIAPIDGIVVKQSIQLGEMSQPGVPLFSIVNMDFVQIQVSVAQEQVNQLKKGDLVDVKVDAASKDLLPGTIEFVSPVSDANNTTFPVKIKVENKAGVLKAGMNGEIYLKGNDEQALEIPSTSVFEKDGKKLVYKLNKDRLQAVEVQVKEKNPDWFYVTSGLQAKEQIVIHPGSQWSDGMQVRVK